MATFQVWVINDVNLGTTLFNSNGSYRFDVVFMNAFISNLEGLFNDVCGFKVKGTGLSQFADANVSCNIATFSPGPSDLLVRITTARRRGFPAEGPTTGTTVTSNGRTRTEVFADVVAGDASPAVLLANLAFHEAMHNKLENGPGAPFKESPNSASIHVRDGTGLAVGVDSANPPAVTPPSQLITSSSTLSDKNRRNMAMNLHHAVPQVTGP